MDDSGQLPMLEGSEHGRLRQDKDSARYINIGLLIGSQLKGTQNHPLEGLEDYSSYH